MIKSRKQIYNENYNCATEIALQILGSKWKGAILYNLLSGKKRFNELKKSLSTISQRMLTLQLRELEEKRIIIRKIYNEIPPKVEYALDEYGKELKPILLALRKWGSHFVK